MAATAQETRHTVSAGGIERRYLLYVPPGAAQMARLTRFTPLAAAKRFAVLYRLHGGMRASVPSKACDWKRLPKR